MKKIFTLLALAITLATQTVSANVTFSSAFPVNFTNGIPTGWAFPSNNTQAETKQVDNGIQITCNQTTAKYRTDIKYNMFGDYNGNTDIWIDIDASQYKVFAIKFIGERPKSGVLKLSNISVSNSWIKNATGYSLSEQGWTDITDLDGNHTYYWTVGGDNWTGNLAIDRIEIVIADITSDSEKTFTVSGLGWYKSVEDLESTLNLKQETAVVNKTTNKGYADLTSAWKAAADGETLEVNEDQTVAERLNCDSRSITVKGGKDGVKITRTSASNMLFLSNSTDKVVTLENITLDGNGANSDRNFIEASSSGTVVFNNVTIQNATSTNNLGLVVSKNSGKLSINGLTFTNCTTNNSNSVEVFVGSHNTTISGNNTMSVSVENNTNAYAINVDGELTNTKAIQLTPYGTEDFTENYQLIKGTTDATKFVLNTQSAQTLAADSENNLLYVTSSISSIVDTIAIEDEDATPEYYNLNGVKVNDVTPGFYIVRRGSKVTKEVVR
jgi:hypothetical protein